MGKESIRTKVRLYEHDDKGNRVSLAYPVGALVPADEYARLSGQAAKVERPTADAESTAPKKPTKKELQARALELGIEIKVAGKELTVDKLQDAIAAKVAEKPNAVLAEEEARIRTFVSELEDDDARRTWAEGEDLVVDDALEGDELLEAIVAAAVEAYAE